MAVFDVKNVDVILNGNKVLEDVTVKLEKPSFLTIMGPNGSGKTTFIRLLLGIIPPSRGSVEVLGYDVLRNPLEVRRAVGYVPQKEKVNFEIPLSVEEVVEMGLLSRKPVPRFPSRSDGARIKEVLKVVGMYEKRKTPFANLSGGQQQRVLIARAVAHEPKILLLDEPFNGVDVHNQGQILEFLKAIKSEGVAIIVVTHDINPLAELTDYVMLLNKTIIAFGTPEEALNYGRLCQIYGPSVQVITGKPCPKVITGDTHA
ncbi:MAG: metal ABC transporter ATP-binding protein [Nitrososphaeria archaeon]